MFSAAFLIPHHLLPLSLPSPALSRADGNVSVCGRRLCSHQGDEEEGRDGGRAVPGGEFT